MRVKRQQLEPDMEQVTGSELGKEYVRAIYCLIYLPCLFNLYTGYIIQNARLDESQAEIKIAGRNINNLRYADDTTLMEETEEELNSLFMRVKEERDKAGLKLNIQNTKIMASSPITSWQIKGEEVEAVTDFSFLASKIITDGDSSHEIKRFLLRGRKSMTNLDKCFKNQRHHFADEDLYNQSYGFSSSHEWT